MTMKMFAAISVGSYELEMKIFEVSKKNGIKEIDRVSHIIELGRETYNYRKISFELVDELCDVLYDFSHIMRSYHVDAYRACATSAIREAVNANSILDRIKVKTGLTVSILSNSEQRFLSYKAFAIKEKNFDKIIENGTILIDMGAGSAQVTLFDKGALITTQNIRLGALRIRELLSRSAKNAANYREIIEEYVDNDLETFSKIFIKGRSISNIIGTGENVSYICLSRDSQKDYITKEQFYNLYDQQVEDTQESMARKFNIPEEQSSLIIPSMMLFRRMFDFTDAKNMWTPVVKLGDGLVIEYAEKHGMINLNHDFQGDILSAAKVIARRYMCNKEHTKFVEDTSLVIYDVMKKIHGLGDRERLILQLSAILHDCGKYISLVYPAEAAFNIIMSTEIIGMSHMERVMVAQIVKYNTMEFDYNSDLVEGQYKSMYLTITKLTSILRVANALDRSHKQKMSSLKVKLDENRLYLTTSTYEDIVLEKGLFDEKAAFFEEVYGIKPVIRQRRN